LLVDLLNLVGSGLLPGLRDHGIRHCVVDKGVGLLAQRCLCVDSNRGGQKVAHLAKRSRYPHSRGARLEPEGGSELFVVEAVTETQDDESAFHFLESDKGKLDVRATRQDRMWQTHFLCKLVGVTFII